MKKRRVIAILLCIVCTGVLLAACAGSHKITVKDKDLIVKCPSRAKVGETVTVETVCVTDAQLYLNVSNADVKTITEGLYEFVMPDCDVEVSAYVSTAGFPGA